MAKFEFGFKSWALASAAFVASALPAHAQEAAQQFNIPPQSLASALNEFGRQSGRDILFSTEVAAGKQSPGVQGAYTPEAALHALLAGTGLEFRSTGNRTFLVQATNASPTQLGAADAGPSYADNQEEIVVTGTNIRGARDRSVINLDREEIGRSGVTGVGDAIRAIPQNFGGGNNPGAIGAPGENFSISSGSSPNLRGLGPSSTLTLLNGRRLPQDTASGAVDISGVPLAALDRIEVLPDGASAVYGSDAVAGVVNLILRDRYDGALTSVLVGGASQGGATTTQFNQLFGTTWASGGLILNYDYENREAVYSDERDFTQQIARPTTLFPETEQHAFFGSIEQRLSSNAEISIDALYNVRDVFSQGASPPFVNNNYGSVEFAHINGELLLSLPAEWQLRLNATASRQESIFDASFALDTDPNVPLFSGRVEAFTGETFVAEAIADGPLLELPGGTVRAAVGAGARQETFDDDVGSIFSTSSERDVRYAFGEVELPLLQILDLSLSGRVEEFSDAGTSFVPRLGITLTPNDTISFRTSYGQSFHAPNLARRDATPYADLLLVASATSPGDVVPVLFIEGGNTDLDPETADTYTLGFDFTPSALPGLKLSVTGFQIEYEDRIARIPNVLTILTDASNDPFVVALSPTAQQQQDVIDSVGGLFFDFTGGPYDPALVAAIADNRYRNIASQLASGVDLTLDYTTALGAGQLGLRGNITYLDLEQEVTPGSGTQQLSGRSFSPARFRVQFAAGYDFGPWSFNTTVNYVDEASNATASGDQQVPSWTTLDLQLAWRPTGGSLQGLAAALSVQNAFDEDPPPVDFGAFLPGLSYDSLNHSAMGRFISLRLSKEF